MKPAIQQFINKMAANPRTIFLIDGLGALVSAFSLGVVLVQLEQYIGMPVRTLYLLAAIPVVFIIYSLSCSFWIMENWRPFLKAIAVANLLYCFVSVACIFLHLPLLTSLGLTYFLLEIVVLIVLVSIEFKIANTAQMQRVEP